MFGSGAAPCLMRRPLTGFKGESVDRQRERGASDALYGRRRGQPLFSGQRGGAELRGSHARQAREGASGSEADSQLAARSHLTMHAFHGDAQAPVAGSAVVPRPVDPRDRDSDGDSAWAGPSSRFGGRGNNQPRMTYRQCSHCPIPCLPEVPVRPRASTNASPLGDDSWGAFVGEAAQMLTEHPRPGVAVLITIWLWHSPER
jgi:hypothetical protein